MSRAEDNNRTAAQQAMLVDENKINDSSMKARFEDFYKEWMPKDPQYAAYFAADLQMLVRSIYAEAQAPAQKHLLKIMESLPAVVIERNP